MCFLSTNWRLFCLLKWKCCVLHIFKMKMLLSSLYKWHCVWLAESYVIVSVAVSFSKSRKQLRTCICCFERSIFFHHMFIIDFLCRKWDIFLQEWGMPRSCFQGSMWWSILSRCFNVYSTQSTTLCGKVQLWSWFWILSGGTWWTPSPKAHDRSSLSWVWQPNWKWCVQWEETLASNKFFTN